MVYCDKDAIKELNFYLIVIGWELDEFGTIKAKSAYD